MNKPLVAIFLDGSCLGNPGPGGFGIIMRYKNLQKTFNKGYKLTTNNRMELLSAIFALEKLKCPCKVQITTDSNYLRQGIENWINIWKKNQWRNASRKPVKNKDLWLRLDKVASKHDIKWYWVKGHSGHIENEICDKLAKEAAHNPTLEDLDRT